MESLVRIMDVIRATSLADTTLTERDGLMAMRVFLKRL